MKVNRGIIIFSVLDQKIKFEANLEKWDTFVGNSLLSINAGTNCWTWNTMISGYCRNDSPKEVLMIYMPLCFPCCLRVGIYIKCGRMDKARSAFEKMIDRDVVTWTTMIHSVKPNIVTLAALLAACASLPHLRLGKCRMAGLSGWTFRLQVDVNVETRLIDMYAKYNCFRLGYQVFTKTSKKRTELVVKPNDATLKCVLPAFVIEVDPRKALSMHSYLVRSGFVTRTEISKTSKKRTKLAREVVELFKFMLLDVVKPNDATLKSVLPAFVIEVDPRQALSMHNYLVRSGFVTRTEVATGLFDIYSKCGNLDNVIASYGMHGNGETSLSLFNEMVFNACGHAGLVDDGVCLILYEIIKTVTFELSSIWGALLGACVIHENVELGELSARWLFKLEPENTENYISWGKIYSAVGRRKDAENVTFDE
uniref:Pentatricopeptide repeat-containing protein n=1 Tax=Solanum lycopersicum TaxID=4081 RepID=A0A3Q7FHM4_SOLLC